MNVGDINSRVWDRLGEDSANPQRFPAATLLIFMKEAVEMWSIAVGQDVGTQALVLTDDTLQYSLTDDVAGHIVEVSSTTTDNVLECVHWRKLYQTEGRGRQRRWRDVRSDRPTVYVPFSYDKIWIWPPQTVATDTLTITYHLPVDDDLTSGDSDIPTIPTEFHPAIVDYVIGRCLMLSASGPRLQEAVLYVSRWIGMLDQATDLNRNAGHDWAPNPETRG